MLLPLPMITPDWRNTPELSHAARVLLKVHKTLDENDEQLLDSYLYCATKFYTNLWSSTDNYDTIKSFIRERVVMVGSKQRLADIMAFMLSQTLTLMEASHA